MSSRKTAWSHCRSAVTPLEEPISLSPVLLLRWSVLASQTPDDGLLCDGGCWASLSEDAVGTDPPRGPAFVWRTGCSLRPRLSWRRSLAFPGVPKLLPPLITLLHLKHLKELPALALAIFVDRDSDGCLHNPCWWRPDSQGRLPHARGPGHRQFANNTATPLGCISDCVAYRSVSLQGEAL